MTWGTNPLKLAMSKVVSVLDFFSVSIPERSPFLFSKKTFLPITTEENFYKRGLKKRLETLGRIPYERLLNAIGRRITDAPTYVTDREWDVLIVLDACRWDTFCKVYGKKVPYICSPGTWTGDWVKENFVCSPNVRTLEDVLVVTASPWNTPAYYEMNGWTYPFKDCVSVFEDGWDEHLSTVLPATMIDACRKAISEQHPKRLLVHFIQPHMPWIDYVQTHKITTDFVNDIWNMVEDGRVSLPDARKAYEENLSLVLKEVWKLVELLNGKKIVVTSDHGNLFGEYGLFGHPARICVPELVQVPWLELEGGA